MLYRGVLQTPLYIYIFAISPRLSSLVSRHSSLVIRLSSLVPRNSSLVIRPSSFVSRHSSLVIHPSSLVIRHSSLVIRNYNSFFSLIIRNS